MSIREALDALVNECRDLTEDEAADTMREILSGEATPAQLGAFLIALRLKGETVDEIAGMARVMRDRELRGEVEGPLLDTCGPARGRGRKDRPGAGAGSRVHPADRLRLHVRAGVPPGDEVRGDDPARD